MAGSLDTSLDIYGYIILLFIVLFIVLFIIGIYYLLVYFGVIEEKKCLKYNKVLHKHSAQSCRKYATCGNYYVDECVEWEK